MKLCVSAILAVMLLVPTVPVLAHHSFNTYWFMDKTVEVTGVVKSLKIVNPHGEFVIEVTEPNGTKSLWHITSRGSASAARQAGWTNTTLTPGMTVKVEGNPSRTPGAKGLAAGKVTLPDGKIMWLGGGGGVPEA